MHTVPCRIHPRVLSASFFFQAEHGIRDIGVTGVQTCALPISCVDWPLARYPYRKAMEGLGGNTASSKFRFALAPPRACIPAELRPAVRAAFPVESLCPLR